MFLLRIVCNSCKLDALIDAERDDVCPLCNGPTDIPLTDEQIKQAHEAIPPYWDHARGTQR